MRLKQISNAFTLVDQTITSCIRIFLATLWQLLHECSQSIGGRRPQTLEIRWWTTVQNLILCCSILSAASIVRRLDIYGLRQLVHEWYWRNHRVHQTSPIRSVLRELLLPFQCCWHSIPADRDLFCRHVPIYHNPAIKIMNNSILLVTHVSGWTYRNTVGRFNIENKILNERHFIQRKNNLQARCCHLAQNQQVQRNGIDLRNWKKKSLHQLRPEALDFL